MVSKAEFEQLRGLVADQAIKEIKKNYATLTTNQKSLIGIKTYDEHFTNASFEIIKNKDTSVLVRISFKVYYIPNSNVFISVWIYSLLLKLFPNRKKIQSLVNKMALKNRERHFDTLIGNYW